MTLPKGYPDRRKSLNNDAEFAAEVQRRADIDMDHVRCPVCSQWMGKFNLDHENYDICYSCSNPACSKYYKDVRLKPQALALKQRNAYIKTGLQIGLPLLLAIIVGTYLISGAVYNYNLRLQYERDVQKYFEYADRASDARTKLAYYNQYLDALRAEGLTQGHTSVYWQNQPNSDLEDNFKVALSLQSRLNATASMLPTDLSYTQNMQQISMTEMCYFPDNVFEQGYLYKHGDWGDTLAPQGTYNHCPTSH